MTAEPATHADPTGYREALDELEALLAGLDQPDLDVDELATKVERAAELITFCRDRIVAARSRVEAVVAALDDDAASGPAGDTDTDADDAPGPAADDPG